MPTIANEKHGGFVVAQALIDGLRITDVQLNQKCRQALRSIGSCVIPWLVASVNDQSIGETHRQRLLATLDGIDESEGMNSRVGAHALEALLAALRVSNTVLNRKAGEALAFVGPDIIDRLISEAVANYGKRGYCLRLLRAAEQTGQRPGVAAFFDLWNLGLHKDPAIQKQAMKVLTSHTGNSGPQGGNKGGNQPVTTTTTAVAKQ